MNTIEKTIGIIVLSVVADTAGLAIMAAHREPQLRTIGEPAGRTSRSTILEDIDPENATGRDEIEMGTIPETTVTGITDRRHLRRLRLRGTDTIGLHSRGRLRPRDPPRASTTITIAGRHPLALRGRGRGLCRAARNGAQIRRGSATRIIHLACRNESPPVRCHLRGCLGLCRGTTWRWTSHMGGLLMLHRHELSNLST